MANDNRNRDDQRSDNPDEPIVAVPVPINNTGSGYVPTVVPIVTDAGNTDAERNTVRGFTGYDSSDDRINREIDDHLAQHSYIDTTAVVITVKDGEATLEGSVPDADQKAYVEEVVAKIEGVHGLHNHLTITKPQSTLTENTSGKQ
jgi:hypothetical protein